MADWRQIQARIRKAKVGTDAPAKLAELYERTRDAMVAFELAQLQEKAGEHAEAAKWYTAAAERFRRAQWRTKAEEALTRLGAPIPPAAPAGASQTAAADITPAEEPQETVSTLQSSAPRPSLPEADEEDASEEEATVILAPGSDSEELSAAASVDQQGKRRRRRGRRGGRGRRRGQQPADAATAHAPSGSGRSVPIMPVQSVPTVHQEVPTADAPPFVAETPRALRAISEPEPPREIASDRSQTAERGSPAPWHGRSSRAGDPALASRMSQLESQLRRLLACSLSSLDEADEAPAGPGVLLLSDSDQVTHYYVEACQTLRIGIGNLLRGNRTSRDSGRLKELMATNLGIPEIRVAKYMREHCNVRWLQLDDGAAALAHFAIAVLRPIANE